MGMISRNVIDWWRMKWQKIPVRMNNSNKVRLKVDKDSSIIHEVIYWCELRWGHPSGNWNWSAVDLQGPIIAEFIFDSDEKSAEFKLRWL